MKRKYTKAIHAKRVARMLERFGNHKSLTLEDSCPAAPYYMPNKYPDEMWNSRKSEVCGICREFVGLRGQGDCPCHALGCRSAAIRTIVALEKLEKEGGE